MATAPAVLPVLAVPAVLAVLAVLAVADLTDRGPDVRVGRAAADVAAHVLGDVGIGAGVALLDEGDRRHDLAGRAVSTLECVVLDEGPLHRVQLLFAGQPLDRRHLVPLAGHGQGQAGEHPPAIDPDRAGAAGALVAALLGAGEVEVLAQRVEQAHPGLEGDRVRPAVDGQGDGCRLRTTVDECSCCGYAGFVRSHRADARPTPT